MKINVLQIKLASIAVHAEELFTTDGREADKSAIRGLLRDPEVRALLDDPDMRAFLPVKRMKGRRADDVHRPQEFATTGCAIGEGLNVRFTHNGGGES